MNLAHLTCPLCGAPPNEPCYEAGSTRGYHSGRKAVPILHIERGGNNSLTVTTLWRAAWAVPPLPRPS